MEDRSLNEEIERAARGLRAKWDSPELWPRIESALREDRGSHDEDPAAPVFREEEDAEFQTHQRGGRVLPFRSRAFRYVAVAATLTLVVSLGALAMMMMNRQSAPAEFDKWVLEEAALSEVERAERAHMESIDRLQKVLQPKIENTSSPIMLSYREKLMLLDDAIAECEAQIEINRRNAHVRKQLLAMYTEKQRTLQQIMGERVNGQ
jgi:hypothetical protein